MPTDEPALAGLTKTGRPSLWRCSAVRVLSAARSTTVSVTGRSWARNSVRANSLSIPTALANTPEPT
jgi:hypothetical protein